MTPAPLALLIEPGPLAAYLDSISNPPLILDVSSAATFAKHHLPGAIHIAPKELQCASPPTPGKLPSETQLQALFSRVGLSQDRHVVVYDDEGGGWAGRLIWTLDVLGYSNYSYLNGGIHAWLAAGHSVESIVQAPQPCDFSVQIDRSVIAEIDDILPRLGDSDVGVWDARSPEEYNGTKLLAKRGGHIPGAVNIDWLELIDKAQAFRLVDLESLQQRLNTLGLSSDKEIITHCQTHHRSGLSYLVMKILGYPRIKGYHGSWSEWGNRDDTPID